MYLKKERLIENHIWSPLFFYEKISFSLCITFQARLDLLREGNKFALKKMVLIENVACEDS